MRNSSVFLIMVLLAVVVAAWGYRDFQTASVELIGARNQRAKDQQVLYDIQAMKQVIDGSIKVVHTGQDPLKELADLIEQAGMDLPTNVSISQTRIRNVPGTEISEWRLSTSPPLICSAVQINKLVRRCADSKYGFQIKSLSLKANQSDGATETWVAEFSVHFLRLDDTSP